MRFQLVIYRAEDDPAYFSRSEVKVPPLTGLQLSIAFCGAKHHALIHRDRVCHLQYLHPLQDPSNYPCAEAWAKESSCVETKLCRQLVQYPTIEAWSSRPAHFLNVYQFCAPASKSVSFTTFSNNMWRYNQARRKVWSRRWDCQWTWMCCRNNLAATYQGRQIFQTHQYWPCSEMKVAWALSLCQSRWTWALSRWRKTIERVHQPHSKKSWCRSLALSQPTC